jgi:hypothetical protein
VKTTVEIIDSLLDQAKQLAAARSTLYGKSSKRVWDEIRDEIYQGRGA